MTRITLLLALSCAVGCTPVALPGTPSTSTSAASVAADVIRFTNDARYRGGLPMLATSAKLMEAARIQAEQMARYQKLDHTIPGATYPTLESRLQGVGYIYSSAAENVAWNQASPQAAVNSWLNSNGHRANIMDATVKETGAAMARSSTGEPYWVQVFAAPR